MKVNCPFCGRTMLNIMPVVRVPREINFEIQCGYCSQHFNLLLGKEGIKAPTTNEKVAKM